jgi:MFS family permease
METNDKNLKLYPRYRRLARDFLFFYTINVLFLTQVKKIDMSAVVLVDTFYSLFVVILQIPISLIIDKIGRRNGIIFGNLCNVIYLILVINSSNLIHFICAELLSATGFSFKDIAETALLNESIEESQEEKSRLFAHINGKAVSGYYIFSAISMVISGFIYVINPYFPMFLSLIITVLVLYMSTKFREPILVKNDNKQEHEKVSLKESILFAFKSKRCRSILIFGSVFFGVISVLATYEICLIEELNVSTSVIGILFAALNIISAVSSNAQNRVQTFFKNKTLMFLGISISLVCILAGTAAKLNLSIFVVLTIITILYVLKYWIVGVYLVLISKYLSNFTDERIDTRLFAIYGFTTSIISAIFGIFASRLVTNMSTADAMIVFGSIVLIVFVIVLGYIKNKLGLKPEEYSEYEVQFDKK